MPTGIADNTLPDCPVALAALILFCDFRAQASREILFNRGIGINDVDNGNYQPRGIGARPAGLANAAPHRNIHTNRYHLNVFRRLIVVANGPAAVVRSELREIKNELNAGTFIF